MRRSGAKPRDLVAVTGLFGKTASGLKILLQTLSAPPKIKKELADAILMPQARLKEGLALAKTNAITASIDSSDGLAWSLHEISSASNLSLYGGEEYELVVTVKPQLWERAEKAVRQIGGALIKIGRVTEEKRLLLKREEETIALNHVILEAYL